MAGINPFSWGSNGQKASPSSVKKYAEIAAALASKTGSPQNVGEGLNRIGEALLYNSANSRAADGEAEGAASRKAVLDALMANPDPSMTDIAGALGNEWVASDPGSQAVVQALMGQEQQQQQRGYALEDRNAGWAHDATVRDDERAYDAPVRDLQLQTGQTQLDLLRNPPEPEIPDSVQALDLRAQRAGLIPGTPEYNDFMVTGGGKGQTINVGGNNDIGTIPAGMMVERDQAGNITGMKPIPGGPAEAEALAAANKAELSGGRKDVSTGIITNAADIARNLAAKPGNTGLSGSLIANLPETDAAELRRQVGVLTANATIENLTAMRAASPTGGALGAVSDRENAMLAAAAGAIDPNASGPQFQRALDNYEKTLLQIVHGPEEGARIYAETRQKAAGDPAVYQAPNPPEGWGGDAALWQFMTPEDRALW